MNNFEEKTENEYYTDDATNALYIRILTSRDNEPYTLFIVVFPDCNFNYQFCGTFTIDTDKIKYFLQPETSITDEEFERKTRLSKNELIALIKTFE